MPTSPYDPPRADVRDVSEGLSRDKPRQIFHASLLLWSSFAIGAFNGSLDLYRAQGDDPAWGEWVIPIATLAFMALLFACISLGQNWARIALALLFLAGATPYFYVLDQLVARSVVIALLSLTQVLLQASAMYLIFTKPGALWFRRAA